jgi:hypothetical protein
VKGVPQVINVNTVLAKDTDQEVEVISCTLSPVDNEGPRLPVPRAHVVKGLHIDDRFKPNHLDLKSWYHLDDLSLAAEVELDSVSMLIGEDVPRAHAVLESRFGDDHEPYAVRTPLAWCVAGPTRGAFDQRVMVSFICQGSSYGGGVDGSMKQLEEAVEKLWNVEKHGFANRHEKAMSVKDRRALEILQNTAQKVEWRYQIGSLPECIAMP